MVEWWKVKILVHACRQLKFTLSPDHTFRKVKQLIGTAQHGLVCKKTIVTQVSKQRFIVHLLQGSLNELPTMLQKSVLVRYSIKILQKALDCITEYADHLEHSGCSNCWQYVLTSQVDFIPIERAEGSV